LTRAAMIWSWRHYLNSQRDGGSPYASPLRADDLSGLPAALIMTAEFDPLRDEGAAYAKKLKSAGVNVDYVCFDGLIHDFLGMSGRFTSVKPGMDKAVAALRDAFAR
jgi:acetyl esterase